MTRLPLLQTSISSPPDRSAPNTSPSCSAAAAWMPGAFQSSPETTNVVGAPSTTRLATSPLSHSVQ
jgi:hypothetical protein